LGYVAGDTLVVINGNLPDGEVWANTWAAHHAPVVEAEDYQALADAFHGFYTGYFDIMVNESNAANCTMRALDTGAPVSPSWTTIPGDATTESCLPTEVALRISLQAAPRFRGGPYLPSPNVSVVDESGQLDDTVRAAVVSAFETLLEDLETAEWALHINRTSVEGLAVVTGARIGKTFDVIRRRRNDVAESYVEVNFP